MSQNNDIQNNIINLLNNINNIANGNLQILNNDQVLQLLDQPLPLFTNDDLFNEEEEEYDDNNDNNDNNQEEEEYENGENENEQDEELPPPLNNESEEDEEEEDILEQQNLIPISNINTVYDINDLKSFKIVDIPLENQNLYKSIVAGVTFKHRHRAVEAYWFNDNEKIITNNDDENDLSAYIIQLITETIFDVSIVLNNTFQTQIDQQKIASISNCIQEWINNMEYRDGSYHLNMDSIPDLQSLLYWTIIMVSPIKYINAILTSPMCPQGIFSQNVLLRKISSMNSNLIFMSIYNTDIRNTIISKVGIQIYTELLNENITLHYQGLSFNTTYIEISSYIGSIYDLIKVININTIKSNVLSLLFKSLSDPYITLRNSNTLVYEITYDAINMKNEFTTEKIQYLKSQIYKDDIMPINYLYCATNLIDNSRYMFLSKISYVFYDDINFIDNINLNKNSPYEILLNLVNFKQEDFTNLTNSTLLKLIEYTKSIIVNCLHNNTFKNTFDNIETIALVNEIYDLKYYKNNLTDDDINELNKMNSSEIVSILNTQLKKGNNYYNTILEQINKEKFIEIVSHFINTTNNNIKFIPVFESLLHYEIGNFKTFDEILYYQYFKLNYENKFPQNTLIKIISDKIYYIQSETSKSKFALQLIDMISTNNIILNVIGNEIFQKYYNYIEINLNYDTFLNLINNCSFKIDLISSRNISSEIKFGNYLNDYNRIIEINDIVKIRNYTISDSEMYKIDNCIRLIDAMQNISDESKFVQFIKLFNIDESFVELYDIKNIFLNKVYENIQNINIGCFTKHFGRTIKADEINFNKLCNVSSEYTKLILIELSRNDQINEKVYLDIDNSSLIKNMETDMISMKNFYEPLVYNNIFSEDTYVSILQRFIDLDIDSNLIERVNMNVNIFDYIEQNKISINNDITFKNLCNYYRQNFSEYNKFLIATYAEKFLNTTEIETLDKINMIINYSDSIESRIPNILLGKLDVEEPLSIDETRNVGILATNYNIKIPIGLFKLHPQLINYSKELDSDEMNILNKCIDDYEMFTQIINDDVKSNAVLEHIKIVVKDDIEMYIELLISNNLFTDKDMSIIMENVSNKKNVLNKVINNEQIFNILFKEKKEIIELVDKNGNYTLSQLSENIIMKYIEYYSLELLIKKNKYNNPRLFAFLTSKNLVNKIIAQFGLSKIQNIYDTNNLNIYDRMIRFGTTDNIPNTFFLNKDKIFSLIPSIKSDVIDEIIENISDIDNLLNLNDHNNNNISYYLASYHPELFKKLFNKHLLKFTSNYNNETFLMKLIKHSAEIKSESIIRWIMNNSKFDSSDYYYDYNSGSVLSYCLKYNNNLVKLFLKKEIIDECIDVYDEFEMICPYSDFASSGKLKMNLLQIAVIKNVDAFNTIIKLNKKKSKLILTEKLNTENFEHNILHIALFNNPESVQSVLSLDMFDEFEIRMTDEQMGGFEKVIDIQPASWYYLQESLKTKYELKINTDEHWYGYNYKRMFKPDQIKKITHYILDKQELGKQKCDICETYSRKVVFSKCRHKVCIVCAIRSDKCGTCRERVLDNEKILI